MQKIKDFGEWLLNYIPPKPNVVVNVLESFKNKLKKCMKGEILLPIERVKICVEKVFNTVSNRWIKWLRPRVISA